MTSAEAIAREIIDRPYEYIREIDVKILRELIADAIRQAQTEAFNEGVERAAKMLEDGAGGEGTSITEDAILAHYARKIRKALKKGAPKP